jgi:hypothetical protein
VEQSLPKRTFIYKVLHYYLFVDQLTTPNQVRKLCLLYEKTTSDYIYFNVLSWNVLWRLRKIKKMLLNIVDAATENRTKYIWNKNIWLRRIQGGSKSVNTSKSGDHVFHDHYTFPCWSQWPRSLRNELSSLARTLGSNSGIVDSNPIRSMAVCLFCVCVR